MKGYKTDATKIILEMSTVILFSRHISLITDSFSNMCFPLFIFIIINKDENIKLTTLKQTYLKMLWWV